MNIAEEAFKEYFKGDINFMTPTPLEYGMAKNYYYELSYGGFGAINLYGVTILKLNTDGDYEHEHNLSQVFDNLKNAREYIEELQ